MTVTKGTYLKALFLLIVFSLNTVVGLACSFSSFFHQLHHHNSPSTKTHVHANKVEHSHEHSGSHHESSDTNSDEQPDQDCCSNSVIQLEKVEKAVSRTIEAPSIGLAASFFESYLFLTLIQTETKTTFPDFVRWRLPAAIQDLRIVIQSFQI